MSAESTIEFPPPETLEQLEDRLLAMIDRPEYAEYGGCATYIRAHREELAWTQRREIAKAVASSEANLVSVAQKLGFLGYSELRAFIRRFYPLDPERSQKIGQIDALFPNGQNPLQAFFRETLVAEIRNFEDTYERNQPEGFMDAVRVLNEAQNSRVVIFGLRSCFSAAHLFHYLYSLFRRNAVLAQDAGGADIDAVRWLEEDDVLVVISLAPYSHEIVQAVKFAQQRGARIVAITDDSTSPLAKAAAVSLFFDSATPSFFHSLGTLNLIVQTLAALLFYSQAEKSMEDFKRAEKQLRFFEVYAREEAGVAQGDDGGASASDTGLKTWPPAK